MRRSTLIVALGTSLLAWLAIDIIAPDRPRQESRTMQDESKTLAVALVTVSCAQREIEVNNILRWYKVGEFRDIVSGTTYSFRLDALSDLGMNLTDGSRWIIVFQPPTGIEMNESHIRLAKPIADPAVEGGQGDVDRWWVGRSLLSLLVSWGNPDAVESPTFTSTRGARDPDVAAVLRFRSRGARVLIGRHGDILRIERIPTQEESKKS